MALRFGRSRCGRSWFGFRTTRRFGSRSCGIVFGGFLVLVASVVRNVKSAAFKNQTRAASNGALYFTLAPAFLGAMLLRANGQRRSRDGLKLLELMTAFLTNVYVSRHNT